MGVELPKRWRDHGAAEMGDRNEGCKEGKETKEKEGKCTSFLSPIAWLRETKGAAEDVPPKMGDRWKNEIQFLNIKGT